MKKHPITLRKLISKYLFIILKWIQKLIRPVGYTVITLILLLVAWDRFVGWSTRNQIFELISDLPTIAISTQNNRPPIALVLGTSKYISTGRLNAYYTYRINTAFTIYQKDPRALFLLSGDNARNSYNEPKTMRNDLIKKGIPASQLHLDYAGFRTLDSIVRASEVFDIKRTFIIISQRFHCERALYIANHFKIDATCLIAPEPTFAQQGNFIRVRELFARIKMALDLYLLHSQPKFLGAKEPIS